MLRRTLLWVAALFPGRLRAAAAPTPAEETSGANLFQYWLMAMDDAIERFCDSLPAETAAGLDGTPTSLDVLEAWLLRRYPGVEATRPSEQAGILDGAARYVGETLRKGLGGRWFIELDDPALVFHGLPQLKGLRGQVTSICPLSLDRRTGTFLRAVYERHAAKAG